MSKVPSEILTVIIAVIVILIFIALFVLIMLIYFNNKKLQNIREREKLKLDFEQALLQTQLEVQEQTMRLISQEIHDNVGQVLSLANLHLKTMDAGDVEKIDSTATLVNKAISDLRSLSKSLNPESISRAGLIQVIKNEFEQIEKTGQFLTSLIVEGEIKLPANKFLILYRMIQEVLNNIIKHSEASMINARITDNMISISDNGKGFDIRQEAPGSGLHNLKQRAHIIGASVEVNSTVSRGTSIIFNFNPA
jgi:two-component system, NarL family, sensor kinase